MLTFAFSHGCDGSPTSSIAIDIPDGVASVAPGLAPGWTIERVGADEGIPTRVVYTADEPVDSGLRAAFDVQVQFSEDVAGDTVAFPVVQTCVDGETAWTEIAEDGQDPHTLDAPAPTVAVAVGVAVDEHGDAHAGQVDATTSAPASALPVALGAGGLLLGAAALVVALVALRRTTSTAGR